MTRSIFSGHIVFYLPIIAVGEVTLFLFVAMFQPDMRLKAGFIERSPITPHALQAIFDVLSIKVDLEQSVRIETLLAVVTAPNFRAL